MKNLNDTQLNQLAQAWSIGVMALIAIPCIIASILEYKIFLFILGFVVVPVLLGVVINKIIKGKWLTWW